MPFQVLDLILLGIMLVSGLLALMRGFTREVLSLVSWGVAAAAAYFAFMQKPLFDFVMPYVNNDKIAQAIIAAVAFLITLIIVSVISVKISDSVVESSVGAFDRTLGFIYGIGRGLVLVSIAYMFYSWANPPEKHEDWIRNAQTLPVIQKVSGLIISLMPPDIADTLSHAALPGNLEAPAANDQGGVSGGQQQGLDNLIDGTTTNPPAMGSGTEQ
ncbi:MAG: CvpA family protein [Phyllobacteriaceae bacterium]|jgi:membrane protein required for colicin V production|nr:CvpA family protein [Phyllobacteriaceae bacterium]